MMNDYRNKYFEMQTSNPLTDLAEMDGLLYIHINICDSWRHSYLGSESKYIFLYKISTRELRIYKDDSQLIPLNFCEFKQSFNFETIDIITLTDDIQIDELFDCNPSVENWYDSATYCFFIKYDKRERWISIDTQFEEKYQPFKILIQMVEKVSNHF